MRRFWILFVVVAMALAIAGPATGKKPEGKPNPKAAPIAAYVENGPWSVHEVDDVIVYTVNVENTTSNTPIRVTISTDFLAEPVEPVVLDLEGGATKEVSFNRNVVDTDIPAFDKVTGIGPDGTIVGTVFVEYGADVIVLRAETPATRYHECGIRPEGGTAIVPVYENGASCILHTNVQGAWTVSVLPADDSVGNMRVLFRDHAPGNFCNADGSSGPISARWNSKDEPREPLALKVFLPDDGVCLVGGAGGATMPIGNPDSFYLWVRHDAVVTISETP
jgi:hypothetical protein